MRRTFTRILCLGLGLLWLAVPAQAQPGGSELDHYYDLGSRQQAANQLTQALSTYQQALSVCSQMYGSSDEHALVPLEKIYELHVQLQNWKAAEQDRRQALQVRLYHRAVDSPEVARERIRLANLLAERNRLSEAESLYREAIAALERTPIVDHDEAPAMMTQLAHLLRLDNKVSEAADWEARAKSSRMDRYR
jgi:tetratricopeptide (TPR) repeat protein